MMRPLILALSFLSLALLPVSYAETQQELVLESRSRVEFAGQLETSARDFAYVRRGPDINGLDLSVTGTTILIREYEYVRAFVAPKVPYQRELPMPPQNLSYVEWWTNSSTLRGARSSGVGSVAVIASELHGTTTQLSVNGTVGAPYLRTSMPEGRYGMRGLPDEVGHMGLPGVYFHGVGPLPAARLAGDLWLYWFNSTMLVTGQDGQEIELKASVWDEDFPDGRARVRHIKWYEASVKTASATLSVAEKPDNVDVWYWKQCSITNASYFTGDFVRIVKGDLPPSAGQAGHSLWINGSLDASFQAPQESDGENRYSFRLAGTAAQYSIGGREIQQVGQKIGLITASGLVAIAVLVKLFLSEHLARATAFLYTKLKKDRLLDVQARDTLYRLIQQTPGINFLALHAQVKNLEGTAPIAFGALAYHLSQMERFQLIVSKREGRYRRYFDVGANMGADTARVALLQTRPVPAIARAVLRSPGQNQAALHGCVRAELGITRQALAYHLRRLEAKDLVRREDGGRFQRYVPTERLRRLAAFLEEGEASSMPPLAALAGGEPA